jgi:hypothetical protein
MSWISSNNLGDILLFGRFKRFGPGCPRNPSFFSVTENSRANKRP